MSLDQVEPIRIAIFGGSNSFMGAGYTAYIRAPLAEAMGREVQVVNCAVGNTFIQYALYAASTSDAHRTADAVVIEYAINDQELFDFGLQELWACGFEGLIRKVRRENPAAPIVCLLMCPQNLYAPHARGEGWPLAERATAIAKHYGASTLDTTKLFVGPDGALTPEDDVYRSSKHYGPAGQRLVGEALAAHLAERLREGPITTPLPPLMAKRDFSECRVLDARQLSEGARLRLVEMENSRTQVETARLREDRNIVLNLTGEVISLVYAGTRKDGVLDIGIGETQERISAYRRTYENADAKDWPFLVSNLLPSAPVGGAPPPDGPHDVSIRLQSATEAAADVRPVFTRGSTRLPPEGEKRVFYLIGVVYVGEIHSVSG